MRSNSLCIFPIEWELIRHHILPILKMYFPGWGFYYPELCFGLRHILWKINKLVWPSDNVCTNSVKSVMLWLTSLALAFVNWIQRFGSVCRESVCFGQKSCYIVVMWQEINTWCFDYRSCLRALVSVNASWSLFFFKEYCCTIPRYGPKSIRICVVISY